MTRFDAGLWLCDVQRSIVAGPMAIPIAVMGAGTVMNAMGQVQTGQAAASAGVAQQEEKDYESTELHNEANSVMGAASNQAANQAQGTELVLSSIRAREAGNVGASTISSTNLSSTVAGRGEYNLLTDVANGQNKAAGLNAQSALDTFQGTQAYQAGQAKQSASDIGAIGTVLSSAGSLYAKYGMGGAPPPTGTGGTLPGQSAYYGDDEDAAEPW